MPRPGAPGSKVENEATIEERIEAIEHRLEEQQQAIEACILAIDTAEQRLKKYGIDGLMPAGTYFGRTFE